MAEFYVNIMPHLGGQVLVKNKFQQTSVVLHEYKTSPKQVRIVHIDFSRVTLL